MRVRDGDRVINSDCAGCRISPMLITPFTEFTEGHRYSFKLTAHTVVLVVCYAWLVFMQLTRDLFAIAKFLLSYRADRHALLPRLSSA